MKAKVLVSGFLECYQVSDRPALQKPAIKVHTVQEKAEGPPTAMPADFYQGNAKEYTDQCISSGPTPSLPLSYLVAYLR